MLKRLLDKWRLWEEAFLGIDDLHGDYRPSLETQVSRLEAAVSELRSGHGEGMRPAGDPV